MRQAQVAQSVGAVPDKEGEGPLAPKPLMQPLSIRLCCRPRLQIREKPAPEMGRCNYPGSGYAEQCKSGRTQKGGQAQVRLSSTDPEGRQAFAAMYELTLARDGESHTDTKVDPSKKRGQGVSLAGGPGTAIAFRRKLAQPLTSRGAVGGPPRNAVWRCKRAEE